LLVAAEKITAKLRHKLENLEIARIQVDELHCFVQKRERRVSEQYTYIRMDADSTLVFSWLTSNALLGHYRNRDQDARFNCILVAGGEDGAGCCGFTNSVS